MPIPDLWNVGGQLIPASEAKVFIDQKLQNLQLPPWTGSLTSGITFLRTLGVL